MTVELDIGPAGETEVATLARMHLAAFPESTLSQLGPELVRLHYTSLWAGPHDVVGLVARAAGEPERPGGFLVHVFLLIGVQEEPPRVEVAAGECFLQGGVVLDQVELRGRPRSGHRAHHGVGLGQPSGHGAAHDDRAVVQRRLPQGRGAR